MKLAIVVGHNQAAQGAVRSDTGETEWRFNSRIARHMERIAPDVTPELEVRTFKRRPGLGYSAEIREVYQEADAWGADATIELHFNGAASPAATGTEVLSSGTTKSLGLAQSVLDEILGELGLPDRGVKTRARGDRGGGSLWSGRAPAILVEPFFGSSPQGQATVDTIDEEVALARAYLTGARRAMQSWPRSDLSKSRTLQATKAQKRAGAGAAVLSGGSVAAGSLARLEGEISAARDGVEAAARVSAEGPLSDMLPLIGAGLSLAALALVVVMVIRANRVEEARVDDHEKGVR